MIRFSIGSRFFTWPPFRISRFGIERTLVSYPGQTVQVRPGQPPRFIPTLVRLWQGLRRDLADSYRPEQHYMRGPGPRWHAKHAA